MSPPPSKRVITHATVTSTKGRRKGEGGRTTAVNVAAVGKDRKQMADAALRARVDAAKASLPPVSLPSHSFRPAPASQRASMAHIGVTSATGRGTLHIVRPAPGTKGPSPAVSPPDRRGALPSGVTSRAGQPLNRLGGDSSCRPDLRGTFYGGKQPPTALQRKRRLSLEAQDSDASDFINDEGDGEMGGAEGDWRSALRSALGGYDPGRFAEVDRMDDRSMEVTRYSDIAAEEQRSLRIAREADRREAEAEAARLAAKEEIAGRAAGNCYKNWDFWGFNSEPAAYGPIPICTGGTPPAAVAPCEELAPLQQGTHSPTGMYIWADPGAGGGVTYWFTSQAGTACEDGMILQVQTVDISV
ncbi:hypothetical protein APUTEX25_005371 [Auxenochlorella protothecoides]|uniref:Uncharacterized protein n=1 Tax=Auxenochlorella protothecoides TaxID=3075 RepID=A0A3M7KWX1_AUXPR|nr:hypothetical protein APUTEX25_005371 [Auxenochlorella protothecoides]|eukprot:RMZ54215.1 hypothetical protein APUTEX25_005371 [Auxenochlorella protothecoides]